MNSSSAALSHTGRGRTANEDACIEMPDRGIWAVSDGMGGHSSGDLASHAVCSAIVGTAETATLGDLVNAVVDRLEQANTAIHAEARRRGPSVTIGATVAALLIHQQHAVCLWSGDSRVYFARDNELFLLTRDHTVVQDLVSAGDISAEEAADHPERHIITRALGVDETIQIDRNHITVRPDDRFLLCTDGVSGEVTPQDILNALSHEPSECVRTIVDLSRARGGIDDSTAVTVLVRSVGAREAGR
jgi:serine/threonine protein phosphatase PrpC